jgi:hypothetical protein
MNDSSRTQGWLICAAVVFLGLCFLIGLLQQSYWAIAIPVAVVTFFALGLSFWVGYTIATVQVEPFDEGEAPPPDSGSESASKPAA